MEYYGVTSRDIKPLLPYPTRGDANKRKKKNLKKNRSKSFSTSRQSSSCRVVRVSRIPLHVLFNNVQNFLKNVHDPIAIRIIA